MKALIRVAIVLSFAWALGRYDVDSCGCDHRGKLEAAIRRRINWNVNTNAAAVHEQQTKQVQSIIKTQQEEQQNLQMKHNTFKKEQLEKMQVQMESRRLQAEIKRRQQLDEQKQSEQLNQNEQIKQQEQLNQNEQMKQQEQTKQQQEQMQKQQDRSERQDQKSQDQVERKSDANVISPLPAVIPATRQFTRLDSESYRMMSGILDVVHAAYKKAHNVATNWAEETSAKQQAEAAYKNMLQEDASGRMGGVKGVVDKMMVCLESGRTDFKSLATINEEIAKIKASVQYSQVNQISSQWSSDFLMRLDATLSKEISCRSALSESSRTIQKKYVALKNSSAQHNTIISWTLMRSEEVIRTASSTGKADMESVKTIVRASMKITDIDVPGNQEWLRQLEGDLADGKNWTEGKAEFWRTATLEKIEAERIASCPPESSSPDSTKSDSPSSSKPDQSASSPQSDAGGSPASGPASGSPGGPGGGPIPRAAANRYPYVPAGYTPTPPNGPMDAEDRPLDGSKSPCKDCDANRNVIDLEGKLTASK